MWIFNVVIQAAANRQSQKVSIKPALRSQLLGDLANANLGSGIAMSVRRSQWVESRGEIQFRARLTGTPEFAAFRSTIRSILAQHPVRCSAVIVDRDGGEPWFEAGVSATHGNILRKTKPVIVEEGGREDRSSW